MHITVCLYKILRLACMGDRRSAYSVLVGKPKETTWNT